MERVKEIPEIVLDGGRIDGVQLGEVALFLAPEELRWARTITDLCNLSISVMLSE